MKGFPVYKRLDDMIAENTVFGVELWVIGQWPEYLQWKAAKTFPPVSGKRLAELLRQCHAYITASLWEPCGMHHVEGAQCGLPLLYHEDGGGIVEAGETYGVGFREENILNSLEKLRKEYLPLRRRLFDSMPSGLRMAAEYVRVVQRVLAEKN
ncbi:MAG: glycosyltransferase [Deltaproteobacteria bacterium]|nr:glycosyltransferase [Deltaproteobacteria bacterium]